MVINYINGNYILYTFRTHISCKLTYTSTSYNTTHAYTEHIHYTSYKHIHYSAINITPIPYSPYINTLYTVYYIRITLLIYIYTYIPLIIHTPQL